MVHLKIIKAIYYDPSIGAEQGTDVKTELSALIENDRLFYNGLYNRIFPDHFKGKRKKLRIEIKYKKRKFNKFYDENEKINLPHDLGENVGKETSSDTRTFNFSGDYVGGDKISRDKNINPPQKGFFKDVPLWLKYVYTISAIFAVAWSVYIYLNPKGYTIPSKEIGFSQTPKNNLATTTLNISDLFSKAYALETVLERQDFFKKYVGDQVYGEGPVKQIGRLGNGQLVVDILIGKSLVSCTQEGGEENEKRLLLLKDKTVSFSGEFTFQKIWGHDSELEIKECQIFR